ncbi:hypothetical protein H8S95_18220 [Pontibacter sp. KCTC 32443]|uniref:hypothetical protein n=1 Tax=Pontibacter TaxID=323449 RepID=UPI00164EA3CE|nr:MULTISPECIES: hypothetical protein [Pontibacter]MBC5776018.1 hypothetical protein [Pontibacter sp. KCTC 32443]
MPILNSTLQPAIANADLPAPVLFHPLKHHLGYIRTFISNHVRNRQQEIAPALQSIGRSQLDFYTGHLSPASIASEVILYLDRHQLLQPDAYLSYLSGRDNHYQTITLSDGTDWVLRWGVITDRYVHLHPARYASQTIRVKAVSLKTAIAATIAAQQLNTSIDLQLVNHVRAQWLYLPPLTVLTPTEGAGKLIVLLNQPENKNAT